MAWKWARLEVLKLVRASPVTPVRNDGEGGRGREWTERRCRRDRQGVKS